MRPDATDEKPRTSGRRLGIDQPLDHVKPTEQRRTVLPRGRKHSQVDVEHDSQHLAQADQAFMEPRSGAALPQDKIEQLQP